MNQTNIAKLFISFFDSKEFPIDVQNLLFEDVNNTYWWMNGNESEYNFAGSKLIKQRIDNLFPIVRGFDEWEFKATDIIYDNKNNKIMIEVDVKGIGFGNNIYRNNYLFILSIGSNGKITNIREYLDLDAVVKYSLNNNYIVQQLNKIK